MKLFQYLAMHGAPKSKAEYVKDYLLAEDQKTVADLIIKENYLDEEDDDEDFRHPETNEPMRKADYIREIGGNYYDQDLLSWADAYYGVRAFGWDDGVDVTPEEAEVLIRLGIARLVVPD